MDMMALAFDEVTGVDDIHIDSGSELLVSADVTPRKTNGRRQVRMVLTRERYECLQRYCRAQGITVTSLVEAFGQRLLDDEHGAGQAPPVSALEDYVVGLARQITTERRRRGVVEEP